jgi:hypothetical protein
MTSPKYLALATIAGLCFAASAPKTEAQVSISIGAAPACPYGYYDYAPYNCAPYGFYGPEWFSGGVFIGAGPWYHGPEHFQGHVDNHFDAQHYHGEYPHPGDHPREGWNGKVENFHGNETRDGHGSHGGHEGHDGGH